LKHLLLLLATVFLFGCASKQVPTGPKPVVRSIALVPATLPQAYSLQNLSAVQFLVPIASLGYAMNSKAKAALLTQKIAADSFRIDQDLTDAVMNALRSKGYEVNMVSDLKRVVGSPDYIEYEKLPHVGDALVHVYFADVGIESPRSSTNYFQRVNVNTMVYVQQNKSYPYESAIYYGVDAKPGKEWAIEADPTLVYPDFDFVINNLETVRTNFKTGVKLAAERIADNIHAALK
jgi:hypothetical protein